MDQLLETLRRLGPMRLAAMGAISVLLVGLILYFSIWLSRPDFTVLYSDLSMEDSSQIVTELESQGIPYELLGGGAQILVPANQVDRVRLSMAQEGLPTGGSLGYEIFDQTDGFGTTNFIQNVNRLRALEGELARTISTIQQVETARVHLVLPERELFSRDRVEPTASVFLTLSGGTLSPENIRAIQNLVAAAVPRLETSGVSIVDSQGNLLAEGPGGDEEALRLENTEQIRQSLERQLTTRVEEMVNRIVGFGNTRAEVSVEMDFDRVTTTDEIFDPESQVVRSRQLIEEEQQSNQGEGIDPVTIANNLPEADAGQNLLGANASDSSNRLEETTNFEINRTVRNTVRESGVIRRLSVAVLVDGTYVQGDEGREYVPRPAEELSQIEALVASAVGASTQRGDVVEVINLRFTSIEDELAPESDAVLLGMTQEDLFQAAEILVLGIVAILVVLLVLRPLLNRVLEGGAEEDGDSPYMIEGGGLQPALAGPGGSVRPPELMPPGAYGGGLPTAAGGQAGEDESELDALMDLGQVEGRVKASSLRKIGEIVEKHPEEAVAIIRNWLYQEA